MKSVYIHKKMTLKVYKLYHYTAYNDNSFELIKRL